MNHVSSSSSNTVKDTNGAPPSRSTASSHAYRPPSHISGSTASCEEWTASKLATASYQDLGGPDDVQGRFMNYLLTSEQCLSSLLHLLRAGTPKSQSSHFSIQINVFELIKVDNVLATMLLRYPNVMLNLLEDAIYKSQTVLLKQIREKTTQGDESNNSNIICHNWTVKGRQHSHDNESFTRVHPRLINLPPHPSCCKSNLHCIMSDDMGRIVQLTGTVVRTSPVRMYEHARRYRCTQKGGCKSQFTIEADLMQTNNALNVPTCCPGIIPPGHQDNDIDDDDDDDENNNRGPASRMAGSSGANRGRGGGGRGRGRGGYYNKNFGFRKGGGATSVKKRPGDPCRGTKLDIVKSFHTDYQEIKIQESASQMGSSSSTNNGGGNILPRSFIVKVEDDLVDLCKPGDDIVVVGSLIPQWQPTLANIQVDIGVAIRAHSIRVLNSSSSSNHNDGITLQDRSTKEKLQYEFEQLWKFKDKKQPQTNDADADHYYWRSIATRNFICRSICPKLYGLRTIKLALLLTLIGGVSNVGDTTTSGGDCTLNKLDTNESKNDDDMTNDNNGTITTSSQNDEENEQHDSFESEEIAVPEQFSLFGGCESSNSRKKHDSATKPSQQQSLNHASHLPTNSDGTPVSSSLHHGNNGSSRNSHNKKSSSSGSIQSRRREQCHLLLVGDPGTGKSQLLRFAAALSPRSVLTTGVGTTSAGLTCAAVRDGGGSGSGKGSSDKGGGGSGDFVLEAGALVLADRGVCCIDEFSCIQTHDRTTIHEAMEQQTLSVAKAGMVCKLNCRTTIVAASNPKGNLYEIEKSLMDNTGIGAPLLSRFDLIFKMVDSSDFYRDERIATHLLNDAIRGGGGNTFLSTFHEHTHNTSGSTTNIPVDDHNLDEQKEHHGGNGQSNQKRRRVQQTQLEVGNKNTTTNELWNIDKLRAYIANVKSRFRPTFTSEAAMLLQTHYEQCRLKASTNNTMHTTVRMFESLIRLSQAHARLMYRPIVTLQDAVAVVLLMERSAYTKGGFNPTFVEDSEFYKDPMTADDDEDEDDDVNFDNDHPNAAGRMKSRADRLFDEEQKALLLSYGLYDLIPPSDDDEQENEDATFHFGGNHNNNHNITLNNGSSYYNNHERPVNNNHHAGNNNKKAQLWNSYHQEQQQHPNQHDNNNCRYRMGDNIYNQHQSSSSSVLTPQNYLNQNNEPMVREPLSLVSTAQTTTATQSFTQHTDCYGRQHLTPLPKKKSSSSSQEKYFS